MEKDVNPRDTSVRFYPLPEDTETLVYEDRVELKASFSTGPVEV
jgi:hypothetical protein